MRALCGSVLIALVFCLGASGVAADEGEARHAGSGAVDSALLALKTRMEARMKEGELLAKTGRLEEALDAYRSVGEIYDRGMVDVRALVASLRGLSAQPVMPAAPARADGGAFGAFRGRAGARPEREADTEPEKGAHLPANRVVDDALRWLAAHQSPDGGWEAAGFANWCDGKPSRNAVRRPDGHGKALHDVGVTGLAMLAFLGSGYTHRGKHPYAITVSKAARYLKNAQDPEGCFGPRSTQQYIYGHATASLAMIELYAMTQSPIFKGSAQIALDFIAMSRNPYFAWRYGVKPGDNDTSVTTWMVMCLKSAMLANNAAVRKGQEAPLRLDDQAFAGARAWLEKVTDPDYGRVGYVQRGTGPARAQEMIDRFPADKSESMTAAGMLARIVMGEHPAKSSVIQKGAQLLAKLPPVWNPSDGSIDMYYWYYGTLAMFQVGGKHWRRWSRAMQTSILDNQRRDTDPCQYRGSWDPIGPWGRDGGRVYSTALMCLCSQVFARYSKVHGTK